MRDFMRRIEAEVERDMALNHLAQVLASIADMPRGDRCRAIEAAKDFYNARRPNERIVWDDE